jgi:hypothetical protein
MAAHLAVFAVLAQVVLLIHVVVILFNVFGLIVIPIGAWQGWAFVRIFWWRALHLALLAVVALQAVFGRACFLTIWQAALENRKGEVAEPLLQRWVTPLIFWPLPQWVFVVMYLAVFAYAIALWWVVPPRSR